MTFVSCGAEGLGRSLRAEGRREAAGRAGQILPMKRLGAPLRDKSKMD